MPATVKLKREGFGIELRRGSFEVLIDGSSVGSLDYGQSIDRPVEPGHHTLRIQRGRYSSRTMSFDATDRETVSFRCHGTVIWPRWLASFVLADLAISLRRE